MSTPFVNRRFIVQVSGANFQVWDSGLNQVAAPASTVNGPALSTGAAYISSGLGTGGPVVTALAAAGTQTLNLFTLPAGSAILAVKCKPTVAFAGGAVTMTTVEVGRASGTNNYLNRFNIFTAAADTAVRRTIQKGGTTFTAVCAWPDTSAATPAAPVACTALGLAVGDRVLSLSHATGPAAGFTEAGSTGANIPTATAPGGLSLSNFESVITVADQIQATGSSGDLTPFTGGITVERGGGLESDAAAGTAINALFRTTGANVSALTAGAMEIDLLILDLSLLNIGNG